MVKVNLKIKVTVVTSYIYIKKKFLPGDGVVYFRNQARKIRSVAFSW